MSVDTFPELTPPVLVIGTLVPGLGPKDVEKTLTWRIEKYVSATPGVDHVESARARTSASSTSGSSGVPTSMRPQTLVQQQVAFAMAAVPEVPGRAATLRSAVRPLECAGGPGGGVGRGADRARSSTTTRSTASSPSSRASTGWPARPSTAAGSGRSTWSSIRPGPRRGASRRPTWRAAGGSRTRCSLRGASSRRSSTPTSTPTLSPRGCSASATAWSKVQERQAGPHP